MPDQPDLPALRAGLKRKLADGTYDPMAERIIKWAQRRFPRLPQGDLAPFLILCLGHFALACLLYLFDGVGAFKERIVMAFLYSIILWWGNILYARLYRHLYRVLSGYVVDSLFQPQDLQNLSRWLSIFSNTKLTLLFLVIYIPPITFYLENLFLVTYGRPGFGGLLADISAQTVNGVILHHLLFLMLFPLILSRYQIDLYELDPGASPPIRQLSSVIRDSSYQLSVYATIFTLYIFYILRIPVFPIAFFYLIPLLGIFIFRQIGLSLIIGRARWITLERLSAKMEKLDVEHHFDNPAIQNQYKAMLDYYNRVKNAEAGIFDARTGMLLFNSFLLPLIAFVLFQFDKIAAFIGRFIH